MKSEENLTYSCIIYLARNSSKEISLDDYKIYEIMNALVLCKNWVIKIGCLKCCFYDFIMFFNMKIEWVLCELKQLKEILIFDVLY
jgi:hypothetical protein